MTRKTVCEKCINKEHTIEEHTKERKKNWYEKTNYRDNVRLKQRAKRGSTRVYSSIYDKQQERDFNVVLKMMETQTLPS